MKNDSVRPGTAVAVEGFVISNGDTEHGTEEEKQTELISIFLFFFKGTTFRIKFDRLKMSWNEGENRDC